MLAYIKIENQCYEKWIVKGVQDFLYNLYTDKDFYDKFHSLTKEDEYSTFVALIQYAVYFRYMVDNNKLPMFNENDIKSSIADSMLFSDKLTINDISEMNGVTYIDNVYMDDYLYVDTENTKILEKFDSEQYAYEKLLFDERNEPGFEENTFDD